MPSQSSSHSNRRTPSFEDLEGLRASTQESLNSQTLMQGEAPSNPAQSSVSKPYSVLAGISLVILFVVA